MSAADNLQAHQYQQLQMFMTPKEFHAQVQPNDFHPDEGGDRDEVAGWSRKLAESNRPNYFGKNTSTLTESIRREGMREPVSVWFMDRAFNRSRGDDRALLRNGHHRVAVQTERANNGEEVYIPVRHSDYEDYASGRGVA